MALATMEVVCPGCGQPVVVQLVAIAEKVIDHELQISLKPSFEHTCG